ncbi:hypothetical protein GCM10025777_26870 [Membranihabitans marinus]
MSGNLPEPRPLSAKSPTKPNEFIIDAYINLVELNIHYYIFAKLYPKLSLLKSKNKLLCYYTIPS